MTDPPFGFGPPGGRGGSGDPGSGPPEPMGPLGDPQQFADALRQFADLMSWQGGPVNWDLAKNVARQTVAAKGDPSVLDIERQKVTDAIRVADLWLEDVTSFPTGIRAVQAWSRSEWVEATLPVWSKLCDPIAARAVDAMGGLLAEDPDELGGELPPELRSAPRAPRPCCRPAWLTSARAFRSTRTRSGCSWPCGRPRITGCSRMFLGCAPGCSARSRTTHGESPLTPPRCARRCRRSTRRTRKP